MTEELETMTKTANYLFLDLETTGLDSSVDEITEAAWITDSGQERVFFVEHDRLPSPWVLDNTDYLTRIARAPKVAFARVATILGFDCGPETYLVGACIAFDDRFLRAAYANTREVVPYHYHVIDVEAMAMGALGLDTMPPLKVLREKLGIPGKNQAAHTALADAREVKLIWDALRARGAA
jgi:oligoribonuclease (3'-5' exoribonuclease)